MVNQSVIDSSVDLEQLKDIEDLIPDMDKAISEKVETFLEIGRASCRERV